MYDKIVGVGYWKFCFENIALASKSLWYSWDVMGLERRGMQELLSMQLILLHSSLMHRGLPLVSLLGQVFVLNWETYFSLYLRSNTLLSVWNTFHSIFWGHRWIWYSNSLDLYIYLSIFPIFHYKNGFAVNKMMQWIYCHVMYPWTWFSTVTIWYYSGCCSLLCASV